MTIEVSDRPRVAFVYTSGGIVLDCEAAPPEPSAPVQSDTTEELCAVDNQLLSVSEGLRITGRRHVMLDRSSTTFLAPRCPMTFQALALLPYICLPSGILIVEPHEGLLAARSMLLGAADQGAEFSRTTDLEPRQSDERDVTFAVLSESLGYAVLSETAQVIRKNWPRARILILGTSRAAIEDHLYDARIDHRARPEDLLAALLMLAEYPRNQCATPPAILADGRVGRLLNGIAPSTKEESDPTKLFANSVPTVYPRGMPSQEQYFRKVS